MMVFIVYVHTRVCTYVSIWICANSGDKRGKRVILKGLPFPRKMYDLGQFIHLVGPGNESLDYRISKSPVHANILMQLPGTMFECIINLYTAQHLDGHSLP